MKGFLVWAISLFIFCSMAQAQNDFFKAIDHQESTLDGAANPWSKHIELNFVSKYGFDAPPASLGASRNQSGWSQIKTQLFAELQYQNQGKSTWQISAKAESEWAQWENNERSWRSHNQILRLRDAYFDYGFDQGVWLKIGKQLFAWGESEGLAITDVLSPNDQREPGQAELRNLRETIPALSLSFTTTPKLKVDAVLTYNADSHRYADAGDPFDLFAAQRKQGFSALSHRPSKGWEYALRLQWQLNGGDIHLLSARVNDNALSVSAIDTQLGRIELSQKRITVTGIAANRVVGHWLWRGEMALWQNVQSTFDDGANWLVRDQYRGMVGLEYAGVPEFALAAEVNAIYSPSTPTTQQQYDLQSGYVIRAQKDSFNKRLKNQLWIIQFAQIDGQILRWDSTYDWDDQLRFGLSAVSYYVNNSQSMSYPFRYHDSINGSLTYQF